MAHFSAATITVFALTLDKEITVGAPLLASPPRRTFTSSPAVVTGVNYYSARRRDLFLVVLEQVRWRYQFVVGYVVMPEHIHLHSQPQKHVRHLTLTKLLSARPPIPVALPIFFPKKGIVPPEATALSKM